MQTWWIGPTVGAVGLGVGWMRGRRAEARLVAIEQALTRRASERPEETARKLSPDVGGSAALSATLHKMPDALASLSDRERLFVTLYYNEALTMAEVAKAMGVSPSTLSRIRSRTLSKVSQELESNS